MFYRHCSGSFWCRLPRGLTHTLRSEHTAARPPVLPLQHGMLGVPTCGLSLLPANSADPFIIFTARWGAGVGAVHSFTWYQDKYWDNYDRCFWTGGQSHVATKAVGPQGSRSKIEASCAACGSHLGHIFPGGRRTSTYADPRAGRPAPARPRPPPPAPQPWIACRSGTVRSVILRDQLLPLLATPSHRGGVTTLTGLYMCAWPHHPHPATCAPGPITHTHRA